MTADFLLSLDIGTTVAKAAVFDPAGREAALAERTLPLLSPFPGAAELDPDDVWNNVLEVIREVRAGLEKAAKIGAAVLSTQGGSLIPVNKKGSPTYNLITWLDQRGSPTIQTWRKEGKLAWIRAISGWSPQPGLPLAVIPAWGKVNPDLFQATHRFLSLNDFLTFRLTGNYCTNPSMAGEMLLVDRSTGEYSEDLCQLAGIHPSSLSPILPSTARCGEIHQEICRLTGLEPGTPLINGGQDHACEALALGLLEPGDFWLACGTAWVLNGVVDQPDLDSIPPQMDLNPHVVPDRWIASEFLGGIGAGLEWLLTRCLPSPMERDPSQQTSAYEALNQAAAAVPPGSRGLVAFPIHGPPSSGLSSGSFWGLRFDHTRGELARSVMESGAFELRKAIEEIQAFGFEVERFWMLGGAARSPIWPQILADVCQVPVNLTRYTHGPALGGALLAGTALENPARPPAGIKAATIHPQPSSTAAYQETYRVYQQLKAQQQG